MHFPVLVSPIFLRDGCSFGMHETRRALMQNNEPWFNRYKLCYMHSESRELNDNGGVPLKEISVLADAGSITTSSRVINILQGKMPSRTWKRRKPAPASGIFYERKLNGNKSVKEGNPGNRCTRESMSMRSCRLGGFVVGYKHKGKGKRIWI